MLMLALALLLPLQDTDYKKLLDDLASDELETREQAAASLVKLGEKAEAELTKRLPDLAGEVKARVEEVLRTIAKNRDRAKILPPLKLVTLDAKDKPLGDVLASISEQTGMPIDAQQGNPGAAVTVSVKDATPLEALDAVCKAAGVFYHIDERDMQLEMAAGGVKPAPAPKGMAVRIWRQQFPDQPRVYVRHYRAAVTHLELTKSNDFRTTTVQASLQMQVLWPPGVKPESVWQFDITSLVDDKGRSLLDENQNPFRGRVRYGRGNTRAGSDHHVQMKYPEADATRIASLKAKVTVRFPGKAESISFGPGDAGATTKDLAGVKVTLKEAGEQGGQYRIVIEASGTPRREKDDAGDPWSDRHGFSYEDVVVRTEDGQELRSRGMSGSGGTDKMTWKLDYEAPKGVVKSIDIATVTEFFYDSFEFELRDIAIPK